MARAERIAGCIGRRPGAVCGVSSFVTLLISVVALVVGEFTVSAENGGWRSRTTAIANRQVQLEATWALDESHWSRAPVTFRRQLHTSNESGSARRLAPKPNKFLKRRLSDSALPSAPPSAPDCWNAHAGWNDPTVVYRAKDATTDLLSPAAFQQVCELEGQVLAARGYNAACRAGEGSGCTLTNGGACLAPLSATSALRSATPGGWSMSCAELVADPAVLQGLVSSAASCLGDASSEGECEGVSLLGYDFTAKSPSTRLLSALFPFNEWSATDSLIRLHRDGHLLESNPNPNPSPDPNPSHLFESSPNPDPNPDPDPNPNPNPNPNPSPNPGVQVLTPLLTYHIPQTTCRILLLLVLVFTLILMPLLRAPWRPNTSLTLTLRCKRCGAAYH